MGHPDFVGVARFAELYGTTEAVVVAACSVLGIDVSSGVPLTREDSIRRVLRAWALEGGGL